MISRVAELPDDVVVVHHPAWPHPGPRGEGGLIELDRHTLDRLDHYDTSTPTSPSTGRIYARRHWRRPRVPERLAPVWLDRWTVFIVETDPVEPGGCYHHPHEVILR